MIKETYIIRNQEDGTMLAQIGIRISSDPRFKAIRVQEHKWTIYHNKALQFEVYEEAQAVITFISDVIDWELAEQLEVELITI